MDQMVRYFNTNLMTSRWIMFFFNLLDKSAMYVIVIWMKLETSLQCNKCVRRALLIVSAKSLARIIADYNLNVQRPVSFHSCLVSEDTNKIRRFYLCASVKDSKSKISRNDCQQSICGEHRVNFVFSARN